MNRPIWSGPYVIKDSSVFGIRIRMLQACDIPAAVELSTTAGWNQTAEDWLMLTHLEPEGCFALECEGRLAATTTIICYGRQLAWIGMVLTHPDFQRRGFARRLVESALTLAEARRMETVKLDATEQGCRLYESLGFRAEQEIQRWSGCSAVSLPIETGECFSWKAIEDIDLEAFGANRLPLLKMLARRTQPSCHSAGFLFWRRGSRASYIGPCVARTPEAAKALLETCLAGGEGRWFWDLLQSNVDAVSLATDAGFRLERNLVRMVRGAQAQGKDEMIYAAAGFELG
jgi:GNAT superfamily N-acetyltransferase